MRRRAAERGETQILETTGWWVAARSERGLVRAENEDAWSALFDVQGPEGRLHAFAVFDGVGGMPRGGKAARAAAAHLDAAVGESGPRKEILAWLNRPVLETGGATTAVVAIFSADDTDRGVLLSVGDSAAYRATPRGVESVALRDSAGWNRLLDFLGNPELDGHAVPLALARGESLLLCTDGVDAVAGTEALAVVLGAEPEDQERRLEELFRLIQARGAPDNATVVLVRRTK